MKFSRNFSVLSMVSVFAMSATASAQTAAPASAAPTPVTGTAISCGYDGYNSKIDSIMKFNKLEYGLVATPIVVGGLTLYLVGESGGIEGPAALIIVGGAAGAIGAGFGTYYLIKGVKKFESRHYTEVANNLAEAFSIKPGDQDIRHTADLVDKKDPTVTEDMVISALKSMATDGSLCDSKGNLVVTDNFRQLVLNHVRGVVPNPAVVNPVASVDPNAAVSTSNSGSGTPAPVGPNSNGGSNTPTAVSANLPSPN